MPFDEVLGHDGPIRMLREAMQRGRLAHAYLFAGPSGVGKALTARHLAAALVCARGTDDSCGTCPQCAKALSDSHPDVRWYRPEGAARQIKIERVRELREQAGLLPYEAARKVFVIDEADRMNRQSENCLLKTLEEPTPTSVLVLVTDAPDSLLPTTLSRCRRVNFTPLRRELVEDFLSRRDDVDDERVEVAAALAEGSLGAALAAASDEACAERADLLEAVAGLSLDDIDGVFSLAERVEATAAAYRDELAEGMRQEMLQRSPTGERPSAAERERAEAQIAAEVRGQYRRKLCRLLDIVGTWYRDVLIVSAGGATDAAINIDRTDALRNAGISPEAAGAALASVGEAKARILGNCNVKLTLDVAFIDIAAAVGA